MVTEGRPVTVSTVWFDLLWSALDATLASWLRTLARPDVEVDVRARSGSGRYPALCASTRRSTVMAVRSDAVITMTPVSPGSIAAAAVGTLGVNPAGAAAQLTAPTAALDLVYAQVQAGSPHGVRSLRELGATPEGAAVLARALGAATGLA